MTSKKNHREIFKKLGKKFKKPFSITALIFCYPIYIHNENKTAWTCLSASSSAAVRKTCGRQKCIDPCVVNSSLMLQLQLANSHSSWGQVLLDCQIKTQELLNSRTHLTSLTSLMCGMCRIMTWPSLGSQYESPSRGSIRHNTTVPTERIKKKGQYFGSLVLLCARKVHSQRFYTLHSPSSPQEVKQSLRDTMNWSNAKNGIQKRR